MTEIGTFKGFVDRGDPSAWDFDTSVLTKDNVFHDLDLSAIVPAGAVAVLIRHVTEATSMGVYITLRKNGNTNTVNSSLIVSQVANAQQGFDTIVPLDKDRKIEYSIDSAYSAVYFSVRGWWIN